MYKLFLFFSFCYFSKVQKDFFKVHQATSQAPILHLKGPLGTSSDTTPFLIPVGAMEKCQKINDCNQQYVVMLTY